MDYVTWNLWIKWQGGGWWLEEEGYDSVSDACSKLVELLTNQQQSRIALAGCVVKAGEQPEIAKAGL